MKTKTVLLAVMVPVIVLGVALLFLFQPKEWQALPDSPNSGGGVNVGDVVFVEQVSVSDAHDGVELSVQLSPFDSSKYSVEVEIQDFNRKVVEKKVERSNIFTLKTRLTNTGGYRVKVRLTDNREQLGEWSKTHTVDLGEGYSGGNKLTANSEYFKTRWATGERATIDDLREAIRVAWGAVEVANDDRCVILNDGSVPPKMMLPPVPTFKPSVYVMKYNILEWDYATNTGKVLYYWCL